jgi:carbon storage regulator
MLVLSRQRDEIIKIGDDIEVTVVDIRGDKVRLGINAPREIQVHRKEVWEAIRRENRFAAQVRPLDLDGLGKGIATAPVEAVSPQPKAVPVGKSYVRSKRTRGAVEGGGMLVLSRRRDQVIKIGDDIEITVVDIRGDKVRLGITAPKEVQVHRKEVFEAIRRENRIAAQAQPEDLARLGKPPVQAPDPEEKKQ